MRIGINYLVNTFIRYAIMIVLLLSSFCVCAQDVAEHISYYRIYDFIDELATDGIIDINSAIKPYSRNFIARKLKEASQKDSLLCKRQQKDLDFFISEFALELDTMPKAYVHWSDGKKFDLSLLQPQFMYHDKYFKCQIRPIIGMDLMYNRHGLIIKRWYGAELQMDIVKHLSIWGSVRDQSYNGNYLNKEFYPQNIDRIKGARLATPSYLNNLPGCAYKEASYGGDYSDVRGGIKAYAWWGSIGFVKDNIVWGDTYNSSNIISGRAPSFPMITLELTPCKWFKFNYIHGWLASDVIDSTNYYYEEYYSADNKKLHYRTANKFIAANMFTFIPIKNLNISLGNSIVYSDKTVKALYFIPFAFYKSLDHFMTKDLGIENQNSQVFINISSRNINHLHLYTSLFVDEFSLRRWKANNKENNPISIKAGFNVTNWPLKNLSYGFEYTRTNTITYKHSIQSITWASNQYNLGHYMGDNAQEFYAHIQYKPIRSLDLYLSYTRQQKGLDYEYLRRNVKNIIAVPVLKDLVFENDLLALRATYEIWPNAYAVINLEYNNARAYNPTSEIIDGENRLDAQGYLDKFVPTFYQGSNFTLTAGFSIGF